ncbi:MAG: hypothetical protein ACKOOG_02030 [Actinomycetota bacterium]
MRLVDACCATRDWDALLGLADRSRRAFERGRQLWPAASYAEYRLALDAPAAVAATVLTEGAARFAPGPVAEVVASTHSWAELAPHVVDGPVAALCAHERVVRGEVVDSATVAHAGVLAPPLALRPFEPEYLVAQYRTDRVEAPGPDPIHGRPLPAVEGWEAIDDPEVAEALRDLVRPWTAQSEGRVRIAAVRGDAISAIAALGVRAARGAWIDGAEALARLAWAGASGGVHGRRRGAAAGRDRAWVAAAAFAGFAPDEPPDADALGAAIGELRWLVWDAADAGAGSGWVLRLAVEDPTEGLAWALDASDRGERPDA